MGGAVFPAIAGNFDAYAEVEACDPTAIASVTALLGQAGRDGLERLHRKRLLAAGIAAALD